MELDVGGGILCVWILANGPMIRLGMSTLLEKALEKVVVLPQDEQDAIASQILASLADEEAWKKRFSEKRDVIRRMAREAIEEDERGETVPLDDLL